MCECCEKCKQNEETNKLLMEKLVEMEERITFLERKHKRNLKRVNVLHWLNENGCEIDNKKYKNYETYFNDLNWISLPFLKFICQKGYTQGYGNIIFNKLKENIFIAFENKKKIFYFNGKKWKIFTECKLEEMLRKINRYVMGLFLDWNNEKNPHPDKYMVYSKNVLGGDTSKRKAYSEKIYHMIWTKLKEDPKKKYNIHLTF